MGLAGEAAYLEALKQEKPLSQKSCEADVQVGLPAAGQNMCCRCQAVRWRLHMLQWQLLPRHLAGLMGMSLTCLAQATGSALILLDASAKAQGNKKTTSKSKITKTCSAWCLSVLQLELGSGQCSVIQDQMPSQWWHGSQAHASAQHTAGTGGAH